MCRTNPESEAQILLINVNKSEKEPHKNICIDNIRIFFTAFQPQKKTSFTI